MIINRQGSALLISMLVLTVITVMSTVFFEKLLFFSRASEGIENSNVAYYKALGIIEGSLYAPGVDKYTPWTISNTACTPGMQLSS
jgi:type II secretory pathway component PulK